MKKEAFYSDSEIGTIDLHSLKKNIHGEFNKDVAEEAEKCAAIRQYLAVQLAEYKAAVEAETAADFVDVEPPITEEVNAKVSARDKVQTGFKSGARAMMELDDAEVREAATVLFELTHKHGLHTDMNVDAQTDAIRDFIVDVRTNHEALLAVVGLTVLFDKLDVLNEEVCELRKDYFKELAAMKRGEFADARKRTDAAYHELVRGVSAFGYVYGTEQFASFISFLNSIIVYYRRVHLKEKVNTSGEGGTVDGESPTPTLPEGEGDEEENEDSENSESSELDPAENIKIVYRGTNNQILHEMVVPVDYQMTESEYPAPPEGTHWNFTLADLNLAIGMKNPGDTITVRAQA